MSLHCCSSKNMSLHCCSSRNTSLHCCSSRNTSLHCCSFRNTSLYCWSSRNTSLHCCSSRNMSLHCCSSRSTSLHCCHSRNTLICFVLGICTARIWNLQYMTLHFEHIYYVLKAYQPGVPCRSSLFHGFKRMMRRNRPDEVEYKKCHVRCSKGN